MPLQSEFKNGCRMWTLRYHPYAADLIRIYYETAANYTGAARQVEEEKFAQIIVALTKQMRVIQQAKNHDEFRFPANATQPDSRDWRYVRLAAPESRKLPLFFMPIPEKNVVVLCELSDEIFLRSIGVTTDIFSYFCQRVHEAGFGKTADDVLSMSTINVPVFSLGGGPKRSVVMPFSAVKEMRA